MARGTGLCELAPAMLNGLCVGSRRVDPKRFRRVIRDMVHAVNGP